MKYSLLFASNIFIIIHHRFQITLSPLYWTANSNWKVRKFELEQRWLQYVKIKKNIPKSKVLKYLILAFLTYTCLYKLNYVFRNEHFVTLSRRIEKGWINQIRYCTNLKKKIKVKLSFQFLTNQIKTLRDFNSIFSSKWPFCISKLRVLTIAKSLKLKQLGLTEKKVCTKL